MTLQFSARQILNCLHSLRPVIDVIAARNKVGSEPEFAIFSELFLGFARGIKRKLVEQKRGRFLERISGFNKEKKGREKKGEENIIDQLVLSFSFLLNSFTLLISFVL